PRRGLDHPLPLERDHADRLLHVREEREVVDDEEGAGRERERHQPPKVKAAWSVENACSIDWPGSLVTGTSLAASAVSRIPRSAVLSVAAVWLRASTFFTAGLSRTKSSKTVPIVRSARPTWKSGTMSIGSSRGGARTMSTGEPFGTGVPGAMLCETT